MASDLENALDGFKDSDLIFDDRATVSEIHRRLYSLEKHLLDAFEDNGWPYCNMSRRIP